MSWMHAYPHDMVPHDAPQAAGSSVDARLALHQRVMSPTLSQKQCMVCLEMIGHHGPAIICSGCRRETHPHCMTVIGTRPVCHGCLADEERRQAYARGVGYTLQHGAAMAQQTAHHAQLVGTMLGAVGAS